MKTLILYPALVLIVIYLWVGQILPLREDRFGIVAANNTLEKEIATQAQKISEIKNFISRLEANPSELAFLNRYVPRTANEQDIVNFFSRAAQNRNIEIFNMNFAESDGSNGGGDDSSDNSLPTLNLDIQVAGQYASLFDFLGDIFLLDRLYLVDTVIAEGTGDSEEGPSDFLVLNMNFRYFYIGEDKTLSPQQTFSSFSFERIKQFSEDLASVDEINQFDNPGRRNPFSP